jgi:hypothetical protein
MRDIEPSKMKLQTAGYKREFQLNRRNIISSLIPAPKGAGFSKDVIQIMKNN